MTNRGSLYNQEGNIEKCIQNKQIVFISKWTDSYIVLLYSPEALKALKTTNYINFLCFLSAFYLSIHTN